MQQIDSFIIPTFSNVNNNNKIILSLFTIIGLFIIIWKPYINHINVFNPVIKQILYNIKNSNLNHQISVKDQKKLLDNKIIKQKHIIISGDTINNILKKYNIKLKHIKMLMNSDKNLTIIKTGQKIFLEFNNKKELICFIWKISNNEKRVYNLINKKYFSIQKVFLKKKLKKTITKKYLLIKGIIKNNFISNIKKTGLHQHEINNFIDFINSQIILNKLHYGDKYSILLMQNILNKKNKVNKILGIKFNLNGKNYFIFRANNGKFYDKKGVSFKQNFMRFPTIKKFRISSKFNLHRLNPITKIISPHKGIDFALPIGTPVLSIGNGKITVAKYTNSAGYYITIFHNRHYMTRYMHLKKLLVKKGQIVKKGECIAFSGNTGRSTGPHLHFEIWINKKAVNPLTAKLPYIEYLIGKERKQYLSQIKILMKEFIS